MSAPAASWSCRSVEPGGAAAVAGTRARRPDPARRRTDGGLARAAREEPRAQALPAPSRRVGAETWTSTRSGWEAAAAARQALPLPRLRRIPVPPDRTLHRRPQPLAGRLGLPRALPLVLRGLRRDAGRARADLVYRASWFGDAFFRALLPALLLHFFLIFPRPVARRAGCSPCSTCPAAAYLAVHGSSLGSRRSPAELLAGLERLTELWYAYFALYGDRRCSSRLAALLRAPRRRRGARSRSAGSASASPWA